MNGLTASARRARGVALPLVSEDQDIRGRAEQRIGSVLHGKYRIDAILGIGGMAVVYAATHRNHKRFAVKVLHPELSLRREVRTRFLREGYAANAVEQDGVVAILDDDVDEHGCAFLVMELLQGLDVQACCARSGGRLPVQAALIVTHQLLEILAVAHAKGVLHRDLKPANLFMRESGRLKVLDFGIARVRERALSGQATRTGAVLGTPAFMAPEQAAALRDEIDARTDLWAVGATLFTLLSGEQVHPGEDSNQVLIRAATSQARSVLSVCPELPERVAQLVSRSLAFEKSARFQCAEEMASAVQSVHSELYGELVLEPVQALVAAAAALPEPVARASSSARVESVASAPTVSADDDSDSDRGAAIHSAPPASREAEPSLSRDKPRRAALFGVALALLCLGLAFDWYATRPAALAPASRPAASQLSAVSLANGPEVSTHSALPATIAESYPPLPAIASAAPALAVSPRASHASPARPTATTHGSDVGAEPALPAARVRKNPLDVDLQ